MYRAEEAVKAEEKPILILPGADLKRLENDRESIAATLRDLVEDLEELKNDLRAERRAGTGAEGGKLLTEVRYWLKQARETEKEIDALRRQENGCALGWGIDFDAAAYQVGCRLASLRACCDEDVS
ncbi:hypothetical protein [Tropicibacter sp. S64]|uniref:hypothetical protein n=1 Tax=Tropicibacter sp. S64 TaxID=3415122 RepID=UPI003C7ACDC7